MLAKPGGAPAVMLSDGLVPHILVVEDNPADVMMLRRALDEHGVRHELTTIDDGEKAIEYLSACDEAHAPDLIVLDLNLPKEDGIEVLKKYRFKPALSETPIVILTSSDSQSDRSRAQMLGATTYIRKPIQLADFLAIGARIRQLLQSAPRTKSAS